MKQRSGVGALGFCLALLVVSLSPIASADTDIWDRAAVPRLARDLAAYRDAERLFIASLRPGFDQDRRQLLAMAARTLERADSANSPDIRPRTLYGRVLARIAHLSPADQEREILGRATRVLEQAIALSPDDPIAIEARFTLAVAWARLGQSRKEIAVYDELLQRESSRQERAVILMNQAEAFMVLGDLDRSVAGYRASVRIAGDQPLAWWGLAVALDRSGDNPGGVAAAANALTFDPEASALHDPNVFFMPSYDRFWYDALGAMARARQEKDPDLARLWWKAAAAFWGRYVEQASDDDRWAGAAASRRKLCERYAKEPPTSARRR